MAEQLVDKVAARAHRATPLKALLWVLAAPFWLLGALLGLIWIALVWAWAAICVGIDDARARAAGHRADPAVPEPAGGDD